MYPYSIDRETEALIVSATCLGFTHLGHKEPRCRLWSVQFRFSSSKLCNIASQNSHQKCRFIFDVIKSFSNLSQMFTLCGASAKYWDAEKANLVPSSKESIGSIPSLCQLRIKKKKYSTLAVSALPLSTPMLSLKMKTLKWVKGVSKTRP